MNKHFLLILFFGVTFISSSKLSFAQDAGTTADTTKAWTIEGFLGLNLNQVSFTNWAAGGENSVSFSEVGKLAAIYTKNRSSWSNHVNMSYGLIWTKQFGVRKNEDNLELETKYGYQLDNKKQWYLTALANFKSQFSNGYNYPDDTTEISKFAAPGYLTLSLGVEYKPCKCFSMLISPLTGKLTFVRDQQIANTGMYGNEPAVFDSLGNVLISGKKFRGEFGAYLNARFEKEVFKNILILSNLELFYAYTDQSKDTRKYVDVNWQTSFLFKVNDWFSASLILHLIYDHDTEVPIDDQGNTGDRAQFKEALGLGVTYKFDNKSKKADKQDKL